MRVLSITEPLAWNQAQLRARHERRVSKRVPPQVLPQWRHAVALHTRECIRLAHQLPRIACANEGRFDPMAGGLGVSPFGHHNLT